MMWPISPVTIFHLQSPIHVNITSGQEVSVNQWLMHRDD